MKKFLLFLLTVVLATAAQAQTDPDFFKFKKQADDCFIKRDYPCAEKWYKAALIVKADDGYCKGQLKEVAQQKKKATVERERIKKEQVAQAGQADRERIKKEREAEKERLEKAAAAQIEKDRVTNEMAAEAKKERLENADAAAQIEKERIANETAAEAEKGRLEKADAAAQIEKDRIANENAAEAEKGRLEKEKQTAESERISKTHKGETQKRSPLLKVSVALVGIGAASYALVLNSQWNTKLSTLNTIASTADPNNTGVILSKTDYSNYKTAYDDAKGIQSMQSLRNICVGVAAGAAICEAILLLKPKSSQNKVSLKSASDSYGMALQIKF